MQLDLLSYAATVRDEKIEQVLENSAPWSERAFDAFKTLSLPDQFTAEVIRFSIREKVGNPHHANAWGAFIMRLSRAGLIEKTGQWVTGTDPKSHAAALPVYRKAA